MALYLDATVETSIKIKQQALIKTVLNNLEADLCNSHLIIWLVVLRSLTVMINL